uniref:Uncharacterized protein n=1 Tax=Glossina brevipalpis TaxID=37001 RepID=A0A1A9WEK4_9MUSC
MNTQHLLTVVLQQFSFIVQRFTFVTFCGFNGLLQSMKHNLNSTSYLSLFGRKRDSVERLLLHLDKSLIIIIILCISESKHTKFYALAKANIRFTEELNVERRRCHYQTMQNFKGTKLLDNRYTSATPAIRKYFAVFIIDLIIIIQPILITMSYDLPSDIEKSQK